MGFIILDLLFPPLGVLNVFEQINYSAAKARDVLEFLLTSEHYHSLSELAFLEVCSVHSLGGYYRAWCVFLLCFVCPSHRLGTHYTVSLQIEDVIAYPLH